MQASPLPCPAVQYILDEGMNGTRRAQTVQIQYLLDARALPIPGSGEGKTLGREALAPHSPLLHNAGIAIFLLFSE